MLRTSELEYDLPPGVIATVPAQPRESARLMVVSRSGAIETRHARVSDLPEILRRGDLLVMNDTRVLPARIEGVKAEAGSGQGGGRVSGLFLEEIPASAAPAPGRAWRVLLKGGRLREGVEIELTPAGDEGGRRSGVLLRLVRKDAETWVAEVVGAEAGAGEILERLGATPLPPYILAARRDSQARIEDEADRRWYQTVYAREGAGVARSVAAPTAGLHFTPALLERLGAAGVDRAGLTLHVGAGTFKPVEAEFVEQHAMHEEWYETPRATLRAIEEARSGGGRAIAVGTTTARALESIPAEAGAGNTIAGATRLLITPGFRFRRVDGLMTNFHLPRSTLLALVGAFLEDPNPGAGAPPAPGRGVTRALGLYREAMGLGYRFYSYGDAMLVLP